MRTIWTCPVGGRPIRRANTYHSCGQYSLEQHFSGKEPIIRQLYDRLLETLQEIGAVTAHSVKTRIVFQAEVQFTAVEYQKDDGRWLNQVRHSGKIFFTLESGREPSRWNTLRALRVLHWW